MNNPAAAQRPATTPRYDWLKGPDGLRAGWRLLIFLVILLPVGYGASKISESVTQRLNAGDLGPTGFTIFFGIVSCALLLVTWIMAKIERRSFADYGLPWRRAFRLRFWQGAAIGFASLTALLVVLHIAGVLSFGPLSLHGADAWKYAALWSVPFFLTALLEEFFCLGYLLFTLAAGIGFWPAAVVISLLIGGGHYFNTGGHGLAPVSVTAFFLVASLTLRRTGDLWLALGLHSAWNWGEMFFYGLRDSGATVQGHLLSSSIHGPVLLTGGAFGLEASWPNIVLLVIWWCGFSIWLRGAKYPHPIDGSKTSVSEINGEES
jgi:uncharacterized protein